MKNTRPLLVIVISLIVGAAAVAIAAQWVSKKATVATAKVVVAARDLEVGTRLRPDMVQIIEWPSGVPLKDAFDEPKKVQDRVINTQLLRGEPIVAARLAPVGEKGGLSAVLSEGKRAITVKVNEIVGVAGFALPGNYVDVMVNAPDDANLSISKIVLERILVLAVAQDASTGDAKPRLVNAVTLEVTPQQAEQMDLARSVGTLSLVLRSQIDKTTSATVGARKTDLFKLIPVIADKPLEEIAKPKSTAASSPPVKPRPSYVRKPIQAPTNPQEATEKLEVIRGIKRTTE